MEELLHVGRTVVTLTGASEDMIEKIKPLAPRVITDGAYVKAYVDTGDNVHAVLDIVRSGATLVSVVPQRQSLEDLFVEIVREVRK